MRGALVCISGEPDSWSMEDEVRFREKFSGFDAVHVVTPQIIPLMLNRIWLDMVSSGVTDIVISSAEFTENGNLEFSDKRYRLPILCVN